MVQMITWLIEIITLVLKKDLHGNAPPPKPAMGLQHANLTIKQGYCLIGRT